MVNRSTTTERVETVDTSMVTVDNSLEKVSVSTGTEVGECVNRSMVTEDFFTQSASVDTQDTSVLAVTDAANKQTMTDRRETADVGSCMTPLRLNKKGLRLTAEEVRKQHARTVANQLESTMLANQRLEKEVKVITHERNTVQAALKDTKGKLSVTEGHLSSRQTSHTSDLAMLEQTHAETVTGLENCVEEKQRRIQQLESQVSQWGEELRVTEASLAARNAELTQLCQSVEEARQEEEARHEHQIAMLKEQAESYKTQFEASAKIIAELRAEQEEFSGLMNDMESSANLQASLQDSLQYLAMKAQSVACGQGAVQRQLGEEVDKLRHRLAGMKVDRDIAQAEAKDLQEDVCSVNEILQRNNNSLVQVERMYEETSRDLHESKATVERLSQELAESNAALDKLLEVKEMLTQQMCEQQDSENLACQALQESQDQLVEIEKALEDRDSKLQTSLANEKKLKQYVENLQHTLDSWEMDREETDLKLEELRDSLTVAQTQVKVADRELQILREVKDTTQNEREQLEDLKNSNQFLEAEKQLYMEALTDYRTKLETEGELLSGQRSLVEVLEANLEEVEKSLHQAQSEKQTLEAELSSVTSDVSATLPVLDSLEERMDAVLGAVQRKFNINVRLELARDRVTRSSRQSADHRSFVASVLASAEKKPQSSAKKVPTSQIKQSNVELDTVLGSFLSDSVKSKSGSAPRRSSPRKGRAKMCLSFSEASDSHQSGPGLPRACSDPAPRSQSMYGGFRPGEDSGRSVAAGFAKIRTIPSLNESLELMDRSGAASLSDSIRSEPEPMLTKVKSMERIFAMVVKAMHMADRASELTIRDLREDLDIVQKKEKFEKTEDSRKSERLNEAQAQIKELKARIGELEESREILQDQSSQIHKLEYEKQDLQEQLKYTKGETTLLSGQLEEIVAKIDGKAGSLDGTSVKEVMSLKKKNYDLLNNIMEERKHHKELGQKAMKRMKVLESNWKKAESDVARFDDLIEDIRQLCLHHEKRSNTHPAILDIIRAIDGQSRSTDVNKSVSAASNSPRSHRKSFSSN